MDFCVLPFRFNILTRSYKTIIWKHHKWKFNEKIFIENHLRMWSNGWHFELCQHKWIDALKLYSQRVQLWNIDAGLNELNWIEWHTQTQLLIETYWQQKCIGTRVSAWMLQELCARDHNHLANVRIDGGMVKWAQKLLNSHKPNNNIWTPQFPLTNQTIRIQKYACVWLCTECSQRLSNLPPPAAAAATKMCVH